MMSYFKKQNLYWFLVLFVLATSTVVAQRDVEKWKFRAALGINNTLDQPEVPGYFSKMINFPTIDVGVEHMFNRRIGARLDLGYNRSSESNLSLSYKLNYTRINLQGVYDFDGLLPILPKSMRVVAHAGPGISMTKPLGPYSNNTYNFMNVMGGLEMHYQLTETLSIYIDGSYVLALTNERKYDVNVEGYSFNGDMAYIAIGLSISLSGSKYCYF